MQENCLPKSAVWRAIRTHLNPILTPPGFARKGNHIYWRITEQLVQFVILERVHEHINIGAYIMPLCIPNDEGHWLLVFGDRLGWFAGGPEYAIHPENQILLDNGLSKAAEHLTQFALPWLDQVNGVQALVDWYMGRPWGRGPRCHGLHGRFPIWMGYCLTYLGRSSEALPLIEENLDKAIRREWPDYPPTRQLLDLLRSDPEGARNLVKQWCHHSQHALGLAAAATAAKPRRPRGHI